MMEEWKFGFIGALMFIGGLAFLFKAYLTEPNTLIWGKANKELIYKLVKVQEGMTKDDLWTIVGDTILQKFDLEDMKKESGYLRTSWKFTCRGSNSAISSEKYRSRIILKFRGKKWQYLRIKCESQEWGWPARRILEMTRSELEKTKKEWIVAYDPGLLKDVFSELQAKVGVVQKLLKIN